MPLMEPRGRGGGVWFLGFPPKTLMSLVTTEQTDNSLVHQQGPLEQMSWGVLPSHINCLLVFALLKLIPVRAH